MTRPLLLLLLLIAIAEATLVVSAKVAITPGELIGKVFETGDLGKVAVYPVKWSPDSSLIAVGNRSKIDVYSSVGELVWESPSLGGTVKDLVWVDNGTLAVAAGSKVLLVKVGEGTLWSDDTPYTATMVGYDGLSHYILVVSDYVDFGPTYRANLRAYDLEGNLIWERSFSEWYITRLAVGKGNGILGVSMKHYTGLSTIYNLAAYDVFNGERLWNKTIGTLPVLSMEWGKTGILAVGRSEGLLYVKGFVSIYDSNGNLLWQYGGDGYIVKSVSWNPDYSEIAVAVIWKSSLSTEIGKIEVFNASTGSFLYSVKLGQASNTSTLSTVAWSPKGKWIAASLYRNLVILDSEMGEIVYSQKMDAQIRSVSWSGDGRCLAVLKSLETLSGPMWEKALVFSGFEQGVVDVEGDPGTVVTAYQGNSVTVMIPVNGIVRLYSTPGALRINYRLNPHVELVGDSSLLSGEKNVTIVPYQAISLILPSLEYYTAPLQISGEPSAQIWIRWINGSKLLIIPESGNLLLYALEGNYTLQYYVTVSGPCACDNKIVTITRNLTVTSGILSSIAFPRVEEIYGRIVFQSGWNATIIVTWKGNHTLTMTIERGGTRFLLAEPGKTFKIKYIMEAPTPFIGDPNALVRSINLTNVSAGADTPVMIPSITSIICLVSIRAPEDTYIRVDWTGGSWSTTIENRNLTVYVVPGDYVLGVRYPDGTMFSIPISVSAGQNLSLVLTPENSTYTYPSMPSNETSQACMIVTITKSCSPCSNTTVTGSGINRGNLSITACGTVERTLAKGITETVVVTEEVTVTPAGSLSKGEIIIYIILIIITMILLKKII